MAARLESAPDLSKEGIGFLLYLMLDEIVDGYLDVIDRFEDAADDIEDAVATEEDGAGGRGHALARATDLPRSVSRSCGSGGSPRRCARSSTC